MSEESNPMLLNAIGVVRSELKQPGRRDCREVVSEVVVDTSLEDALDGLEDFSHLVIVYWMHRLTTGSVPNRIHPHGQQDLPVVGLFSTRSPRRPNPLGITVVELLERRGNVLKVKGLDAIEGTPVIDIKPYIPNDSVTDARVPSWLHKRPPAGC